MPELTESNENKMDVERRQHSPDESVTGSERANVNNTRITISDRTMATLGLVLASMALMGMFWALDKANNAALRAELLAMEVTGFKNALHAHGIRDVNPHLPGEPE